LGLPARIERPVGRMSCIGDYSPDGVCGQIFRVDVETCNSEFQRHIEGAREGDNVKVIGKIDESYCKYYKMMYISAVYLKFRQ
jgi:hypothetical protein